MDIIWDDDIYSDALMILLQDDSDDEEEGDIAAEEERQEEPMPHVGTSGSRIGKYPNIDRQRVMYSHLLYKDFWGESPVYNKHYFKRFFKLPIELFDDIVEALVINDDYFRQKCDAAGKIGLSPIQKIASAVRQLTSGVSSMEHDDKYRLAASTGLEAMKRTCKGIVAVYSDTALRHPTINDVNRLLDEGKKRDFRDALALLIVCIGNGRIVLLPGKVCFRVSLGLQLWFWRRLLITIVGFGILTSDLQALSTT